MKEQNVTKAEGTSLFSNALLWFGAGVSIAEIITGTYFAPLGFGKGFLAIVIGHIIGCFLLFLMGYIGAKSRKSSMDTVKISFGSKGSIFFAVLNILQLVGWTAIMIFDGALAANEVISFGTAFWSIVIGLLIILWIFIGIKSLGKLNTVAMAGLFILTLILSFVIFRNGLGGLTAPATKEALSFGAAVELSVAMPLSWIPLISDYTREAKEPKKASLVSAITYGLISVWMYSIGLGTAIFTGQSDIAQILLKAGLGMVGLLIVVFSTVTTTFLDAYSAGVSSESIFSKLNGKWVAILTTVIGMVLAITLPIYNMTSFLFLIGSVFAPMAAILIVDFFILKKEESEGQFNIKNLIIWLIGFGIYRYLLTLHLDFVVIGITLLDMLITMMIAYVASKVVKGK